MNSPPELTDEEIDRICAGLTQNAAKVRYLQGLGLIVGRKPNGRPLVGRAHFEAVRSGVGNDSPQRSKSGIKWREAA